jgi:deoxyribose-phosphate aldolase
MSYSDARIALACMDLVSLGEDDTPALVAALARRARTPYGTPSTLCVYPELILATRMSLMREGIPQVRVATVVNFPDGGDDAGRAERETRRAIAVGADEINLQLPAQAASAQSLVARVKACCGKAGLAVILDRPEFAAAALAGGADFLKVPARSGTDALASIGGALAHAVGPVGLGVFGAVDGLAQASRCVAIAARLLGRERVVPARFRIGANALLEELLPALAAQPADAD